MPVKASAFGWLLGVAVVLLHNPLHCRCLAPLPAPLSADQRLAFLKEFEAVVQHPVYVLDMGHSAGGQHRVLASAFMGDAVLAVRYPLPGAVQWGDGAVDARRVSLFAAGVYCPGKVSEVAASVAKSMGLPPSPVSSGAHVWGSGCGVVDSPWGLVQAGEWVYVSSFGADQVLRFHSETGAYGGYLGGPGVLDCPEGMAVDPATSTLYVVNYLGNDIATFDLTSGAYTGSLGQGGALAGPEDCALDGSGRLLVTSHWDDSVHAFDIRTGAWLGRLVGSAADLAHSEANTPLADADPAFRMWHKGQDRAPGAAAPAAQLGPAPAPADTPEQRELPLSPVGIQVLPDDTFLVASFRRDAVMRYGPGGQAMGVYVRGGGVRGPSGLAIGSAGEVFVASYDNHRVMVWNATQGLPGATLHPSQWTATILASAARAQ